MGRDSQALVSVDRQQKLGDPALADARGRSCGDVNIAMAKECRGNEKTPFMPGHADGREGEMTTLRRPHSFYSNKHIQRDVVPLQFGATGEQHGRRGRDSPEFCMR